MDGSSDDTADDDAVSSLSASGSIGQAPVSATMSAAPAAAAPPTLSDVKDDLMQMLGPMVVRSQIRKPFGLAIKDVLERTIANGGDAESTVSTPVATSAFTLNDISPGDIILMNFGGRTPFTEYRHAGVATRVKKEGIVVLDCLPAVGCGEHLLAPKDGGAGVVHVVKWNGPPAIGRAVIDLAQIWASEAEFVGRARFVGKIFKMAYGSRVTKGIYGPTGQKYYVPALNAMYNDDDLPHEPTNIKRMFCSKFAAAVWVGILGALDTKMAEYLKGQPDEAVPHYLEWAMSVEAGKVTPGDLANGLVQWHTRQTWWSVYRLAGFDPELGMA